MNDDPTKDPERDKNPIPASPATPKRSIFKRLQDVDRNTYLDALQAPRIVICEQGVVTYSILSSSRSLSVASHLISPQSTDQKIKEILAVNPDTDFTPEIQSALGITVHTFQKAKRPSQPAEDVIF